MREPVLKGMVHGALALVTALEAMTAKTRARRVLLGAAAGWHLYATYFHFVKESQEPDIMESKSDG